MERQSKLPKEDRFISNLPDHLAHHILSFLEMKDVARFSFASKRCKELCFSVPSLIFDGMQYKDNPSKRVCYMNFLDRYLLLRSCSIGITTTRKFCIRWYIQENTHSDEKFRVLTWLHNVVGSNSIESLELEIIVGGVFAVPDEAFRCGSLTSLQVDLHQGLLKLPSSNGSFTKLEKLVLKNVRRPDNNNLFGDWVSNFCKFLKILSLEYIYGIKSIRITSSSLKSLSILNLDLCHVNVSADTLNNMVLRWFFHYSPSNSRSFKICAPNLERLTWEGYALPYCFDLWGNFEHLQKVLLSSLPPYPSNTKHNFTKFFHKTDGIETLGVSTHCVMGLFGQGCMPTFDNVHHLQILISHLNLDDEVVPAISSFLKGLPNLSRLKIRSTEPFFKVRKRASGFSAGYWESQDLMFINHVKLVDIELFKGENELMLIQYLLKYAKVLEKMTIFYAPPLPSNIVAKVNEYKMTSTAIVDFNPK